MIDIFSKSFVRDGFCVSNQDKSVYVQSHAMCFYGDTVWAIVIWILTSMCSKGMEEASLKSIKNQIIGVFGHGCAHMFIGISLRDYEIDLTKPGYEQNYDHWT